MKSRDLRWIFLAILSASALVYLVGNASVQLWDRDEPRYAQTSRQMLQSGDWVVPRFLDGIRTAKPIFIYWCQALSMSVFGDNAFAARFPSALAMVATLSLLGIVIWKQVGAHRALWTVFIFSSCGLTIASAKMALTDAVLLFFITIGQLCIYRLWRYGFSLDTVLILGLAIGLGGLTKGPVVLGVHLTTVLGLWGIGKICPTSRPSGYDKTQFPLIVPIVIAVAFIVVFPWIYLVQSRAPAFLSTAIGHDVIERARTGHEGHAWPPGYYTLMIWLTFFPWSLLIPAALVNAWKQRDLPTTRFALAAIVGPWIMFELIAGKLPHYVLPTYPAWAYLVADMLVRASRGAFEGLQKKEFRVAVWIWAGLVGLLGGFAWALLISGGQYDPWLIGVASLIWLIAIGMGVGTACRFGQGRVLSAARVMGIGMGLMIVVSYPFFVAHYQPLQLSLQIVEKMQQAGAQPGERGYMIDYKEPSLAFHQGGGLREQRENNYLNESSPTDWPQWIVLTERIWKQVREPVKQQWKVVAEVRGWAYNEGGKSKVLVIRKVD